MSEFEKLGRPVKAGRITPENSDEFMEFSTPLRRQQEAGEISASEYFIRTTNFLVGLNERDGVE